MKPRAHPRILAVLVVCLAVVAGAAQAQRTEPLQQGEILQLIQSGVPMARIAAVVEELGIAFDPTDEILAAFRSAGADESVLATLRTAGAKWHLRRGADLQSKPQHAEAEQAARAAIRLAPDLPEAHQLLGEALFGQENYDGALAAFREALRRKPDAADAHVGVCAVFSAKGKPEEALPECREGLRLAPNHVRGNIWLGQVLAQQRDYAGSLAAFREAKRLRPDLADAYIGSCSTLRLMGDANGALRECGEALKRNPQDPQALWQMGQTLMAKSDFAGAETAFREALRWRPEFLPARVGLCRTLATKNELDAALAVCQEALKQRPSDPSALLALGFVRERMGDLAAALEAYRSAFLALPQDEMIKSNYERMLVESQRASDLAQRKVRAKQLLDQGSFAQAVEEYRAIVKDEPVNRDARFALGDALQALSRPKEATAEYLAGSHGPAVYRINTGGAYQDSQGCLWEKDRYFDKGRTMPWAPAGRKVEGTSDPALFQTIHYNAGVLRNPQSFKYSFPVPDGEYRVNLYFAETFPGALLVPSALAPGARLFDIRVNGAPVFSGVDIFSAVGGYHSLVLSTRAKVRGGTLPILFEPRSLQLAALVTAIEVIAINEKTP